MITLRHRPIVSDEGNTFAVSLDGPVILVSACIRRTDVSRPFPILLPCWLAERDRTKPVYPYPLWEMFRRSENAYQVMAVPLGPGDRCDFWLVEIPGTLANDMARAM